MSQVVLNITDLETNDQKTFAVLDISKYPTGFTPINPTMEITVPGFLPKQFTFTPSSLQVYNSDVLGITCDTCELAILPDGIYKVKYTMTPAYQYFIEKSFLRTNQIYAKLDKLFLHLEFMQCDLAIKEEEKRMLDSIEFFIEGAKAAAHNCLEKEALKLYKQANKMIEDYEKRCKNKKLSA